MSSPITPNTGATATDGSGEAAAVPDFLRPRRRSPGWHWALILLLMLGLALQVALADRARLAADAGTRPWISSACALLRCSLPAWREPAAYTMTARDVRPLPAQPGNLQVRASIRNDARWAQAWPTLKLSLSDPDGRVLGSRVFTAQDYLDDPAIAGQPLGPGQSAQLAFIVRDPGTTTAAFAFEFL